MMFDFDESYWTDRYEQGYTGWDIGYPSPPIVQYLDQIEDKKCSILIPGAGNAYEAAYAYHLGFKNTFILDISSYPLTQFKKTYPEFPDENILHEDFFKHQSQYDLIIEQTFFCALHPSRRLDYSNQMKSLLAPEGKLVGVLFGIVFERMGPPFGGEKEEYQKLFEPNFRIIKLEPCVNSIPARKGTELFLTMMHQ